MSSPHPHITRRLSALLVLLAAIAALSAAHATPADAAVQVTGKFRYDDRSGGESTLRPISYAEVEVWRYKPRTFGIWGWGKDATSKTDANGAISVPMPYERSGIVYAVRVLATNYAAVVWPNDAVHTVPFYQEPGQPDGANFHRTAAFDGARLDFTYDFADPWTPQHFNLAETVRRGHDFVAARRGDADPLLRANVQPGTKSPTGTFYNPVSDTLEIESDQVFYDMLVLHEYGHFVEETISAFPWLPTQHNGCEARDISGNIVNSAEHAWMEGFADWFAQAVRLSTPGADLRGTSGTPSASRLESPYSCEPLPSGVTPDEVEEYVDGSLWDLFDQAGDEGTLSEDLDTLGRRDRDVIQILDKELDSSPRNPTIWDFRNAWRARGLPSAALDQILVLNKILDPPPVPPTTDPPTTDPPTDPDPEEPPELPSLCDRKPWLCE